MRRLLLFFIVCSLTFNLSAQFNCGLEVGYLDNFLYSSDKTVDIETHSKSGFKIAGIVDYNCKNMAFESGIGFQRKGGIMTNRSITEVYNAPLSLEMSKAYYLNIPLLVGYKVRLKPSLYFIPKIGGFLNIGVGGDGYLSMVGEVGDVNRQKIKLFSTGKPNNYSPMHTVDYGGIIQLALQYRNTQFRIAYEEGHESLHVDFGNTYNRTLIFSIAYLLKDL